MPGPIDRRAFLRWSAAGAPTAVLGPGAAEAATPAPEPAARPSSVLAYGYDHDAYHLDPGPHLFLDWRYIAPGRVAWLTPDGRKAPLSGDGLEGKVQPGAIRSSPAQVPFGIRLEAQSAVKVGPVIRRDKPWERHIGGYVTLRHVDGKYRLWYEVTPPEGDAGLLCYAESADGHAWEKPKLGLADFRGSRANNITFGGSLCPDGFHGSSVFLDPSAPDRERFKVIYMAKASPEAIARLKRERPGSVTPIGERKGTVIKLAVSPDGQRWTALDDLLMCHMSDTQTTAYYDPFLKRYVGYFRMACLGRRVIGRSETDDYRRWPVPEMVLFPNPPDGPSDDYYTNGHCLYPGTRSMHLMFPTVYHRHIDSTSIRLAASLDGRLWEWVPGGSVFGPGAEPAWDAGCLFAGCGLAVLPDDRVALAYGGYRRPHKFPRFLPQGDVGLATWKRERLAALVADEEGEFYTPPLTVPGDTLHLNVETKRAGSVTVEVAGRKGRRLEDCDPLVGDHVKARVTWKGQTAIGVPTGGRVQLRFRLRAAKLFSLEVRPGA
jgi:hypothetical protein